jgi:hypothetical protein
MQLDARAGETGIARQKADPIRVALGDTGSVGSRRKGLRTKEGRTRDVYRLRWVRHKGSSRERSRAARGAGAPLSRTRTAVGGGDQGTEKGERRKPPAPLAPSTPDRSDVP